MLKFVSLLKKLLSISPVMCGAGGLQAGPLQAAVGRAHQGGVVQQQQQQQQHQQGRQEAQQQDRLGAAADQAGGGPEPRGPRGGGLGHGGRQAGARHQPQHRLRGKVVNEHSRFKVTGEGPLRHSPC